MVEPNRSTSIRCPGSRLEEGELFPVLPIVVRLRPQVRLVWPVPDEEGQHRLHQQLARELLIPRCAGG